MTYRAWVVSDRGEYNGEKVKSLFGTGGMFDEIHGNLNT